MAADQTLIIPSSIKPADGRFGSGPSKVRPAAIASLAGVGTSYLGTSHRKQTVRHEVARLRRGLADFFAIPNGYEVVIANGGTNAFWDSAAFGLIRGRAQLATFGEFGAKFAAAVRAAPWLADPTVRTAPSGSAIGLIAQSGIDAYASVHNETSTGVSVPVTVPVLVTKKLTLTFCREPSVDGVTCSWLYANDVYDNPYPNGNSGATFWLSYHL